MIMAQSLFMSLKKISPDCLIDVLAPAWSLPLLERMPEVAKGIVMPLRHGEFNFAARVQLGRELRQEGYDQAIVLPNSWKSALIPYFAGIHKRTGYRGECRWGLLNDIRKLDKSVLTMTVQRFVALGLPPESKQPPEYPIPALLADATGQDKARKKFGLDSSGAKILVLCPGAEYGPAKRWPAAHFAQLAEAKISEGWQVWLLGSEKDSPITSAINELTQNKCLDFAGKTSLVEAVDLISLADCVVSNDSGLMHLAAALNKKTIAIYGSSDPKFTPPLNKKARITSLNLPCSPCFKRECPLYPGGHPSHNRCLAEIAPERIIELISR